MHSVLELVNKEKNGASEYKNEKIKLLNAEIIIITTNQR